jgi:pimeloyl-ACP methyl ester carboxylesterase
MKILPAGMQFTEIKITNEYTTIPDELKHKVRFIAKNSQNSELLNVELDTFKLSNQPVAITYEPETVEDQEIIDSYGGLDNTPAYLVRLRPVLKINNERIIVAQDGLPMGSEYALTIDLVSPQGTETITNSMITGNLTVIGITAGRAAQSSELSVQGEKDAERLLYESAQHYIDRWNKAEDELASLLHLSVARPLPTVVTLGGMIDVTYLLDMPHGFTWKGVYIDADHRSIETVTRTQSTDDRQKLFMQLASLQGSILENRIFEDDFKVESISTAKLMQLCTSNSVLCTQILTIDKTSVDAILPTLYFDDNIKVDILNAVNQNFSIRIPQSDITYHDWTGTGYIKENLDTGESGWMLSGMIAGGCPVDAQWLNQHYQEILSEPYTGPSNSDPLAVRFLVKVASTDKQPPAMVDGILPQYLAVFVSDSKGLPVSGAKVTFKTVAGEGKLRCLNSFELPTGTAANECTSMPTNKSGIAKVQLILGQKTGVNPIYQLLQSTDAKYTQLGLNLITASVQSNLGEITLAGPFEAYGKPDVRDRIEKVYGEGTTTVVNNPAGSLSVKVVDKYGNPISNVPVTFSAAPASSLEPAVTLPTVEQGFRNIEFYRSEECNSGNHIPYPLYGDCSKYYPEIGVSTEYFGAVVNAVLGNTVNTKYTVKASATGISSAEFTLKSTGYRATNDNYLPTGIYMGYLTIVNDKGEPVNAARAGEELKAPLLSEFYQYSDDYMTEGPTPCNINNQWTSCWKVKPTGTVTMKKVENGTVTFTPAQGGGVSVPINTNEAGLYGARYTTGVAPAVNKIIAEGRANIDVAVVYYYSSTKEYLAPSSWPTTTNITLNSGQSALFNSSTNAPIYLPTSDTKQTLEYIVYGVDVPLTIEPGLILVNDDGQTTTDMTFKYTILPPEYNAVIADVDVFTSDTNTDTWVGYLPGDKTQGQGSAGYVKGSRFDINTHYKAQVVLNRGTDAEVKGRTEIRNDNSGNDNIVCEQNEDCMDKVTIPFGKIELFTVPSTTQEAPVSVIGGATDGVTKLQLKLTVKYGFEELSDLNWNLMDPQLLSAATSTERGSILDDQGNNIDSWPVTFYSIDSSGVATTTYRVPQTFVRFGTSQETQDKDRPDRNVQIRLADSSNNAQGSSDLRLIRPPVLLVHGLWGSGDRNDKKEYTWKIFEPALNQKGLFEINNVDYHRTNASSIAVNAQRIERGLDDMLGLLYDKRFAATRVDIIAHSMGGLITRHYCMNGFSDCIERIHKFITIDTPHEGSELADILAVYRQNRNLIENQVNLTPPFTCYGAVDAFISGKYLFKKMKPHPIHLGAIDDLASGRWTEPPFNAVASGPWTSLPALSSDTSGLTAHTIAGVATGSGLDSDMEALWDKVLSHCGFTLERVFGISATTNDRIVTQDSQDGSLDFPASEVFTGVDHFSILRSVDVVDRMKDLLESCMPSADFEGGL